MVDKSRLEAEHLVFSCCVRSWKLPARRQKPKRRRGENPSSGLGRIEAGRSPCHASNGSGTLDEGGMYLQVGKGEALGKARKYITSSPHSLVGQRSTKSIVSLILITPDRRLM